MKKFLTITVMTLSLTVPAVAADNGGFGSRFANQAPSALQDGPASPDMVSMDNAAKALAEMQPAAGDVKKPVADKAVAPQKDAPANKSITSEEHPHIYLP